MNYIAVAVVIVLIFILAACEKPLTDGDIYLRAKQLCGHETIEYQSCIDYHVEEMN